VVVHREGYAACFKLPVHNFWEYLDVVVNDPDGSIADRMDWLRRQLDAHTPAAPTARTQVA
ncbi:MAG: hypothetical protein D6798_04240, partial [Deltaproteobacteria bacterium]